MKYINTKQAKNMRSFKHTKKKLLKTNADIWFNKICRNHQLTPKQINIKVNDNSKQSKKNTTIKYGVGSKELLCSVW